VKYYENIRFVYEIESRVREFKRVTAPPEPSPKEQKQEKEKKDNNTSGQPEPRQERNYSQGENQPVLASIPNDPPVVTVTAYRRLS
jgi:Sec-independent protein translocase protein TatA